MIAFGGEVVRCWCRSGACWAVWSFSARQSGTRSGVATGRACTHHERTHGQRAVSSMSTRSEHEPPRAPSPRTLPPPDDPGPLARSRMVCPTLPHDRMTLIVCLGCARMCVGRSGCWAHVGTGPTTRRSARRLHPLRPTDQATPALSPHRRGKAVRFLQKTTDRQPNDHIGAESDESDTTASHRLCSNTTRSTLVTLSQRSTVSKTESCLPQW